MYVHTSMYICITTIRKSASELNMTDGITSTGQMLVITKSANNTLYGCGFVFNGAFVADTGIVYVASMYV